MRKRVKLLAVNKKISKILIAKYLTKYKSGIIADCILLNGGIKFNVHSYTQNNPVSNVLCLISRV